MRQIVITNQGHQGLAFLAFNFAKCFCHSSVYQITTQTHVWVVEQLRRILIATIGWRGKIPGDACCVVYFSGLVTNA